jgi:D-alanyl-D-alanine carboxypeptidase
MQMLSVIGATLALAASGQAADRGDQDRWRGTSSEIHGKVKDRIVGSSWREGCPVGLEKLRLLRLRHWGFDGDVHNGRLVVHRGHDREVLRVMRRLFRKRFPIRRMKLIDAYGADDHRSMNADNTSGFNCRYVAGTTRWSMHAYGKAIDINPIENPYVTSSGHVSPPAGEPYVDRSRDAKGMIHRGDLVVRAFRRIGWKWGGNWSWPRDYQHLSSNGK